MCIRDSLNTDVQTIFKALGLLPLGDSPNGIEVHTPIDGSLLARLALTSETRVNAAIERAHTRFLSWRELPAPKRGALVRAFGETVRRHKELLGRLITLETGKILQEGLGEVQEVVDLSLIHISE